MLIRRKMFRKRNKKAIKRFWIIVICAALVYCVLYADSAVKEMVAPTSVMNAEELIYKTVNEAVSETLAEQKISYSDLITTDTDRGEVTAVSANTAAVNSLKSEVIIKAEKELAKHKNLKTYAQLGSIIDSAFLSNRGPQVEVVFDFYCSVNGEFSGELVSAGLNQTSHIIKLNISTKFCLMIVSKKYTDTLKTDYVVAQTVISGEVPKAYGNIYGLNNLDN